MKIILPLFLLLLINNLSANCQQKQAPWFVDRFKISAGAFVPVSNTDIRVGTNDGSHGTDIDFEDDLGFDKTTGTFLADLQWRSSRRSRFDLSYYHINRKAVHTLDKDITFGDNTYNINTSVKSFFNTDIYRFSYGYAILAKPKYELGLLIGAHIVGGSTGIGIYGDNIGAEASSDFRFTAPLPDFGIWGGYAFSNRFALNGEADYLALTVGDISGRILAYNIAVTYRILPSLHAGLGFTGFAFKVDAEKTQLNGHFKWSYNGPALTVTYAFGKTAWAHN